MKSLDTLPMMVAGMSSLVLAATLPGPLLIRRLTVTKLAKFASYVGLISMILCCALFIAAMFWGIETNWSDASKAGMAMAWALTVPAGAGALVLIGASASAEGSGGVRFYFVTLGIVGLLILGLPALIFLMLIGPGHA